MISKNTKTQHSEKGASVREQSREQKLRRKQNSPLLAAFEHHQATAVDSLLRLLADTASSLLTWLVIGIALALPMCLLLLLQNLQNLGSGIEQNSTISLYMETSQSETQLQQLLTELATHADIEKVELITAAAALAEFERESGFTDVLQGLETNPLPPVLLVTPRSESTAEVSALQTYLQAQAGVEMAQVDLQWLQRLSAIVAFASRLALLLALLLSLGVVLAIGNTVRMAIENRRAEIVVVKLVGGTDAYVARPFLYTGFWYGLGGGLCALLIIYFSMFALQGPVARLLGAYNSDFVVMGPGISNSFLLVLAAAALGWFGAWISVLRNLRAIEPA